jgi:hypothetical protein
MIGCFDLFDHIHWCAKDVSGFSWVASLTGFSFSRFLCVFARSPSWTIRPAIAVF